MLDDFLDDWTGMDAREVVETVAFIVVLLAAMLVMGATVVATRTARPVTGAGNGQAALTSGENVPDSSPPPQAANSSKNENAQPTARRE